SGRSSSERTMPRTRSNRIPLGHSASFWTAERGDFRMSTAVRPDRKTDTHTVTGGHLVARALKAEGVEAIFTLCGGHIIDVYEGCTDAGIRIIDVRHEQAAAHASDAW